MKYIYTRKEKIYIEGPWLSAYVVELLYV